MVRPMRRRTKKGRGAEIHSLPGRERDEEAASGEMPAVPEVRLGKTEPTGVSPSMYGLLERGVMLRPEVARKMHGRIVFRFTDSLSPLRVVFSPHHMTVEDGDLHTPDLAIVGTLPDIIHFVATPLVGGIPNPARVRGLVALARVARRRVRIEGDPALARSVLRLLSL
jgi:hypothetical protein